MHAAPATARANDRDGARNDRDRAHSVFDRIGNDVDLARDDLGRARYDLDRACSAFDRACSALDRARNDLDPCMTRPNAPTRSHGSPAMSRRPDGRRVWCGRVFPGGQDTARQKP